MTFVLFFAVLFVLILVHEWGHFIVAKKTGMRVDEFGIGFPPKLFGIKRGETEYTFNALPIGGFVRIYGENGEDVAKSKVPGVVLADSFTSKSKAAQAAVLIAGVTMNVLFAWFLMSTALMVGVPTAADENAPSDNASLMIADVIANSPAAVAEIPIGATIGSLKAGTDELVTPTPTAFKEFVGQHANEPIVVNYTKDGNALTATLDPVTGLIASDEAQPAIGVSLSYVETVREPIHRALYLGAVSTWHSLVAITNGLTGLLVDTVSGTADFSQVAGPIGIAGLVGDAAQFGITSLMLFTAMISLNLAVINLLPLPALDGGRLVFVAIEAVSRRTIPAVWAMRINMIGFALLMLLMIVVTYGDIIKII